MKTVLCCWLILLLPVLAEAAEPAGIPRAVPTFECVGLYWKTPDGAGDKVCEAHYRALGDKDWHLALPLWFDGRDQEYRGSIMHLRPDTTYEVTLQLQGTAVRTSLQMRTWSETFHVGKTVSVPAQSNATLTITDSGSPESYSLYAPAEGAASATIDVAGNADHCIVVKASYVILRGLTLRNARIHGVLLGEGVHDVIIEECDISGWGRVMEDGWGKDYDSAIYSSSATLTRVIVQRNRIHHPRSNSNNWQEARPGPGKREPTHPEGPQTVCFWDSDGNHVIRYNTVFSDDTHQYNDIFGAGHNFSLRGFPNRDSDIYGNLLSHCWDDAIESEGANCNVRIWGNYITEAYVGVACASTSIGPLYVWRNVTGVIRESPAKISGAFFKTSDKMSGGRIYVFHNTILQPVNSTNSNKTLGAVVGLGWGGPMTNVISRNNILQVTRQSISDRAHCPLNDFDYDLFSAPFNAADSQEKHGIRGVPEFVQGFGLREDKGAFALSRKSPGFDAGVVLPNFNDDYTGAAPDLGAHEAGTPAMEFGANAYHSPKRAAEKLDTNAPEWSNVASVRFSAPWTSPFRVDTDCRYQLVNREGDHLLILNKTAWAFFGCQDPAGYLDRARTQGVNVIRVALEGRPYWNELGLDLWPWGGTRAKPDWRTFNESYWQRVEERVRLAGERGIGLDVVLYFTLHPEADAATTQQRYWDEVLRRLGKYANILTWEIANEYTRNEIFQDAAGRFFKEHDPWRRPVCTSDGTTDDAVWPDKSWMDLAINHTCTSSTPRHDLRDWYLALARNTHAHGKPAWCNESGRENRHGNDDPIHRRKQGWLWYAAGCFWTWHSWDGCEGINDRNYRAPGEACLLPMVQTFRALPFWRMNPNQTAAVVGDPALVQATLATAERDYLFVYCCTRETGQSGAGAGLTLRLPDGAYRLTLLKPADGTMLETRDWVSRGLDQEGNLALPSFTDDLAVRIERTQSAKRTTDPGTQ